MEFCLFGSKFTGSQVFLVKAYNHGPSINHSLQTVLCFVTLKEFNNSSLLSQPVQGGYKSSERVLVFPRLICTSILEGVEEGACV